MQASCPEASQWGPEEYLLYRTFVAVAAEQIRGFAVWRELAPGESEILNLVVDPDFRRRGLGRMLLNEAFQVHPGEVFLEVRESNSGARRFYQALGFHEVGIRPEYYKNPPETAIVMKFHSC